MRFVKYWLPVLALAALILSASNDHFSSRASGNWLHEVIGGAVPNTLIWLLNGLVRKCSHMGEYGLLAALGFRAARGERTGFETRWATTAMAIVVIVSVADEAHQRFTHWRSGSAFDVLLDFCSAGLVLLLMRTRITRAPAVSE